MMEIKNNQPAPQGAFLFLMEIKDMNYWDKLKNQKDNMKNESQTMAERYGISQGPLNGPQDAFRHAYTSAKTTRDEGSTYAQAMGTANEWKNELDARTGSRWASGNPRGEWSMDEHNNKVGREIGRKAKEEGWDDDRIAQEVKKALEEGKLIEKPTEQQKEDDSYESEESQSQSSFLPQRRYSKPSLLDYYDGEERMKQMKRNNDHVTVFINRG